MRVSIAAAVETNSLQLLIEEDKISAGIPAVLQTVFQVSDMYTILVTVTFMWKLYIVGKYKLQA